jgi:hypothetical protein
MPHGERVPNVLLCFLFDWFGYTVLCSVFREVQAEKASCVCLAGVEATEEIGAGFLRFDSSIVGVPALAGLRLRRQEVLVDSIQDELARTHFTFAIACRLKAVLQQHNQPVR